MECADFVDPVVFATLCLPRDNGRVAHRAVTVGVAFKYIF
jgi:hypothetical protein